MKFVLKEKEAADILGIPVSAIRFIFRHGDSELPHIWVRPALFGKSTMRIMSFPLLDYVKEHCDDETTKRLRKYIEV